MGGEEGQWEVRRGNGRLETCWESRYGGGDEAWLEGR